MAENVGSMEITYSVTVNQALRNLDRLNKKMDETTEKTEEQTEADKSKKVSLMQAAKAWTVMGAVATSALYGIIKASSYAAIYTSQFGATVQQLANVFMEETGLNKAIEDFLREFQVFTDRISAGDSAVETILKSLTSFKDWFIDQSLFIKFVVILGSIMTVIGLIIGALGGLALASAAITSGWAALVGIVAFLAAKFVLVKLAIAKIVAWFAAGSVGTLALAAAIGALVGLIVVWLMKKAGIMDWFAALGQGFRDWDSWIKDIILIVAIPLVLLGAAINDIVNGDFGFPMLKKGLEEVGGAFERWEKRILGVIGTIINKVRDLIRWIKRIPSKISSGGVRSSSTGTSISPSSMPGGGDYSSHQFGGPIKETGLSLLHAGEYVVPKGGTLISERSGGGDYSSHQFGGPIKETGLSLLHAGEYVVPKGGTLISERSGGGDTYNIAPVINITTSGGAGMTGDISRQVSKAIADEIKRITKV